MVNSCMCDILCRVFVGGYALKGMSNKQIENIINRCSVVKCKHVYKPQKVAGFCHVHFGAPSQAADFFQTYSRRRYSLCKELSGVYIQEVIINSIKASYDMSTVQQQHCQPSSSSSIANSPSKQQHCQFPLQQQHCQPPSSSSIANPPPAAALPTPLQAAALPPPLPAAALTTPPPAAALTTLQAALPTPPPSSSIANPSPSSSPPSSSIANSPSSSSIANPPPSSSIATSPSSSSIDNPPRAAALTTLPPAAALTTPLQAALPTPPPSSSPPSSSSSNPTTTAADKVGIKRVLQELRNEAESERAALELKYKKIRFLEEYLLL